MPNHRRNDSKIHSIALSGLLFALAMALSFVEGTLVLPGLLPGMKLGLANIVVMYALFFMGPKQALVLDLLKALFVFLVSGWTAGFLSLCGGLLSLLVMWLLYYHAPVPHLVHPLGMRCAVPQHRPASGCQCDLILGGLPLLCAGDAGARPRDGRTDVHHAPGAAAGSGPPGLQYKRKIRGFAYV